MHLGIARALFPGCYFADYPPLPLKLFSKSAEIGITLHIYGMFHAGLTAMKPCYFWPRRLRRAVSYVQHQVCGCAIINMPYFVWDRNENIAQKGKESKNALDNYPCSHHNKVR